LAKVTCTISGSYRRFLEEVAAKMRECSENTIEVLSPASTDVRKETDGFVYLKGDEGEAEEIEGKHLDFISRSDFLYVVNPDGYIGPSATLEIGYAVAKAVPVFCSDKPTETVLNFFVEAEPCIKKIRERVSQNKEPQLYRECSLPSLQEYVEWMVKVRGFEKESLRDVALLLMEEVGELAKAIRRRVGLKEDVSESSRCKKVGHELVDCLIYLLDIANISGVDLGAAFLEKEKINSQRTWGKPG